jgi:hypothetical protein
VAEAAAPPVATTWYATAALVAAVVLSAIPALLVRIPPMLDYPNHYVRLWLLGGGIAIPPVSQMYTVDWSGASTNIAIDLIAWALRGVAPVGVVGPLVLILAIVLPPLGLAMLGRRVFGALHWWHVLCFLLAWNYVLLLGFVNYEISLGAALLAACVTAPGGLRGLPAVVFKILVGGAILIAHPFGFLFYAALLGGLALGPRAVAWGSRAGVLCSVGRVAGACWPVAVPAVLLLLFAPVLPGHGNARLTAIVWQKHSISAIVSTLLTGFKTYALPVDAIVAVIFGGTIVLALLTQRLRVHAGLLAVCGALIVASLLMPRVIFGTAGIETRLPCMLALSAGVAVLPGWRLSRRAAAGLTAACLLLVAARDVWIGGIWLLRQADLRAVDRVLALVPAGAAVLPMEYLPTEAQIDRTAPLGRFLSEKTPTFWHYPVLAIMDRHAFVPNLFTAAGKQPIRVLAPWNAIAVPEGTLASVDELGRGDPAAGAYPARWRECFDYILVVNADMPNAAGPLPVSPALSLAADEGFARLYRIARTGGPEACR